MESRKKIIFLGDSITDAGHDLQMAPEGQSRLGDGYVSRIAAMLGVDEVDTARQGGDAGPDRLHGAVYSSHGRWSTGTGSR